MTRGPVVFFHAHPDDEAIFTGATMLLLARAGWPTVLVVATSGEQGESPAALEPPVPLGQLRQTETMRAAETLGVTRVEFLGYQDSGLSDEPVDGGFAWADLDEAADRLAAILRREEAAALVTYDPHGIYGHPDHVMVHRAGMAGAARAGLVTVYQTTVDREYLHFVETHLVHSAREATGELGLAGGHLGLSTVEVTTTVDGRRVLPEKRRAMAAHASQIPETASVLQLPDEVFSAVYGYEWFMRSGPPGPIEELV
jgi:LmbE family N-acetylglucosaminyl deacetylase